MNRKILAFGVFFAFFAMSVLPFGCYYDNEITQYGLSNCDTTSMSYSRDIAPIIQDNCLSCHAPGGVQEAHPYDTYAGLKVYANNTKLLIRINDTVTPMPQSGLMTPCNRHKIESWVNAGAPNN